MIDWIKVGLLFLTLVDCDYSRIVFLEQVSDVAVGELSICLGPDCTELRRSHQPEWERPKFTGVSQALRTGPVLTRVEVRPTHQMR